MLLDGLSAPPVNESTPAVRKTWSMCRGESAPRLEVAGLPIFPHNARRRVRQGCSAYNYSWANLWAHATSDHGRREPRRAPGGPWLRLGSMRRESPRPSLLAAGNAHQHKEGRFPPRKGILCGIPPKYFRKGMI